MLLLLGAAIGICFFMLIQLGQKKEQMGQAWGWAMAIQLLWIVRFGLFYMKLIDIEGVSPVMVIYDQTLLFLDGPLIWLYTRSLTENKRFSARIWLNFIPFLVMLAYETYQLFTYPEVIQQLFKDTWEAFQNGGSTASGLSVMVISGIIFFNLYYLLKSVRVARAYNAALEDEYSTTDRLTADWIISFQRWWLLLFVVPLLFYFVNYIWPIFPMLTLAGTALVSIIVLSVIFNSHLLKQVYVILPKRSSRTKTTKKPETVQGFEQELAQLLSYLRIEKPYLEETLTLSELAQSVQLKPAELTEVIKVSDYENFYDLINSYRIEEVKEQLLTSDEQVIQLAYQCGFKSKSTFNKIFKEKTGQTPKAYRNTHQ